MIVKLAGTSGSGKSSLIREAFKLWTFAPVFWTPLKPKVREYVAVIRPGQPLAGRFNKVVVLGDYRSPCGGMDGISSTAERQFLVTKYAKGHRRTLVLSEGLIYGQVYGIQPGGLGYLSEQAGGVAWVYAFMNTPAEVCLERVAQRRTARGVTKPLTPKNTVNRIRAIGCVRKRVLANKNKNQHVYDVDYAAPPEKAFKALLKFLEGVRA